MWMLRDVNVEFIHFILQNDYLVPSCYLFAKLSCDSVLDANVNLT